MRSFERMPRLPVVTPTTTLSPVIRAAKTGCATARYSARIKSDGAHGVPTCWNYRRSGGNGKAIGSDKRPGLCYDFCLAFSPSGGPTRRITVMRMSWLCGLVRSPGDKLRRAPPPPKPSAAKANRQSYTSASVPLMPNPDHRRMRR
jgi:hypothetical protein